VNRVYCINHTLIATGDDDGVIKVGPEKTTYSFFSSGIQDNPTRFGHTRNTTITSPILPTLTTRGS